MVKYCHFIKDRYYCIVLIVKRRSSLLFQKIPKTHGMTFRKSNIDCFRCVKYFFLLVYQPTDLRLFNSNSYSIQYAAVSNPNRNELAAKQFPLTFAKEF